MSETSETSETSEVKESQSLKELSRLYRESCTVISDINATLKEAKKVKAGYEERLLAAMEAAGTDTVKNENGTFSRRETLQPVAEDWDLIYDYVRENDAFHLLYRSILGGSYRELIAAGETVPGVKSFNKVTLSVHKPTK